MIKQIFRLTGCFIFCILIQGCQWAKNAYAPSGKSVIAMQPSSVLVTNENQAVSFGIQPSSRIELQSLNYQWFFNGAPIDADAAKQLGIKNGTETSKTLEFTRATTNNVGFYECALEHDDPSDAKVRRVVLSEEAQLMLSHHSVLTVYGTPIGGASIGSKCPPPYAGYVIYRLPESPYGWYFPNGGTASDPNGRTDTVVAYFGSPLADYSCSSGSVVVPPGTCAYRFTIYFKTKPIPCGPYPIQLIPK
jgi:hypothetical protein